MLDFVSKGDPSRLDGLAFGLADFMASALQERGVVLLERRSLRYVLSERRLEHAGIVSQGSLLRQKLPWVGWLLAGEIESLGEAEFRLVLAVTETRGGLEVLELEATGRYPEELASAIGELADEVTAALAERVHGGAHPVGRREIPGFTRRPEVALLFYQGLDQYRGGRPELAEEYFRQAFMSDRNFWLAAVWRMKCYEWLGLSDLAAYVRSYILQHPEGMAVVSSLAASVAHQEQRLVITLRPPREPAVSSVELSRALRDAVTSRPDLEIFSPLSIRRLADELDLELSGEFAPHPLAAEPWLTTDAILTAGLVPASVEAPLRLRVELLDAPSGELFARAEHRFTEGVVNEDQGETCRRLVDEVLRRRGRARAAFLRPPAPFDYELPTDRLDDYSRETYAYLLRNFAAHPEDPVALLQHLYVHQRNSHWEYVPGTYEEEWPYLRLLWSRLLSLARRGDVPRAVDWLSHALWNLRLHGYLGDGDRDRPFVWFNHGKRLASAEDHFADLLRDHPDDLATRCVQYYLALEQIARGRHEAAFELLSDLVAGLADADDSGADDSGADDYGMDFGVYANIYYFAAREARAVGRLDLARRYIDQALEAARHYRRYPTRAALESDRKISNVVMSVKPVIPAVAFSAPGFGGHRDGRFSVHSMSRTIFEDGRLLYRPEQVLNEEIERFAEELSGLEVTPGETTAEEPSLEQLFRRAMAARGPAGVDVWLVYLRRVVDEVRRGAPLDWSYYYVEPKRTLIPRLLQNAPRERRREVGELVETLISALKERPTAYRISDDIEVELLLAAQRYDAVVELAAETMAKSHPGNRRQGILWQAEVLRRTQGPPEVALFLEEQLELYERDWPMAEERYYLDLVFAAAEAAVAADLPSSAASHYEDAIVSLHERHRSKPGGPSVETLQREASLRFRWAVVEAGMGHRFEAAELLKEVAELSEAHRDWLIYYSGSGANSDGTLPMHAAAVHRLQQLREPPSATP